MLRTRVRQNRDRRSAYRLWIVLILGLALAGAGGFALWQSAAPAEAQAQGPLGWTLGESWVMAVTQPVVETEDPGRTWITHQYRYTVTGVPSRGTGDFVIQVSHADPQQQPDRARGPIVEAHYRLGLGGLGLAGIRAKAKGQLLGPDAEQIVIGQYFPTFIVPGLPFTGGIPIARTHPGRGGIMVTVRRHNLAGGTEDWYPGDPWYVGFDKPGRTKAELVEMSRQPGRSQP